MSRLLPKTAQPWLAMAVTASLWPMLLAFVTDPIVFGRLIRGQEGRPIATDLAPWQSFLVLALVGFFSAAALAAEVRVRKRIPAAIGVFLIGSLALCGLQIYGGLPANLPVIGLGILGLAVGLTAGVLSAPLLRGSERDSKDGGTLLSWLALFCTVFLSVTPFALENPLTAPFTPVDPVRLIALVPQRFYLLIKASMLWVPLGFVLAAGGLSRAPRYWVPAGVATFFLVGWPFFGQLSAGDLFEVLAAPVGVWVGLWLGEQTGRVQESARARTPESIRSPPAPPAALHPKSLGSYDAALGILRSDASPAQTGQPMAEPSFPKPTTAAPEPNPTPAPTQPMDRIPGQSSPNRGLDSTAGFVFGLPRPHPAALIPALGLLAAAAWGWWDFPRFQLPLGIALLLYLFLLIGFRHAWLAAIPALLPVLDLAPWTGRFFFDESDLFLLTTLGAVLLHRPDPAAGPYLARPVAVLGGLFAATTLISLLTGLLPLSPLDANAFASYFSHYNALRVGKGFAWGLAFFLLLRWTLPRGSTIPARLFTTGILVGLLGVILIGMLERSQYADLLDFAATYRITASFSSMHTGGSHLPAFLALAVPFVWLWVVGRRDVLGLLVGLPLLAGAVYLVVSTVTRASVLALVVELLLLSLFWLRGLRGRGARIAVPLSAFGAMAAVAIGLLFMGMQGGFFQQRMAMVERDTGIRLDHWRRAVWMMDRDLATELFGMGLGTFPETYLQQNPFGRIPGNFRYASEAGNGYLLLGSGETLYLAQRLDVKPDTKYRLAFDLRGEKGQVRLTIPLCEKHLLDSRDCVWNTYEVPGTGSWEHKEVPLDSGSIGRGGLLDGPPVELFLYNGEQDQLVAVDNLSLRDPAGNELLHNGDFSAGGDFWFFKTHDHLAWHIKNLWVSLLFEQGWIGFIAFNLLILAVVIHLGGPAWRGYQVPAAVLTAIAGFLSLGLFSSPFDAPRLTVLFFAVMATGLLAVPAVSVVVRNKRKRLSKHRKWQTTPSERSNRVSRGLFARKRPA